MTYPGEGQIAVWIDDYFNSVTHRGMRYEAFLVMKACDWQREQDAKVCNEAATKHHNALSRNDYYSCDDARGEACEELAAAIRHPKETP